MIIIVYTKNGILSNLFLLSLISNSIYKMKHLKVQKYDSNKKVLNEAYMSNVTVTEFMNVIILLWPFFAKVVEGCWEKKWRFGLLPSSFSSFWPYHPYFSEEKTKKCPWSVVGFQFIESILPKFLLIVL